MRRELQLRKMKHEIPLKAFRIQLFECLALKKRVRGRPSKTTSIATLQRIETPMKPRPSDEVRLDMVEHFPVFTSRGLCNLCVKGHTSMECAKCELRFCLMEKEQLLCRLPYPKQININQEGDISEIVKTSTQEYSPHLFPPQGGGIALAQTTHSIIDDGGLRISPHEMHECDHIATTMPFNNPYRIKHKPTIERSGLRIFSPRDTRMFPYCPPSPTHSTSTIAFTHHTLPFPFSLPLSTTPNTALDKLMKKKNHSHQHQTSNTITIPTAPRSHSSSGVTLLSSYGRHQDNPKNRINNAEPRRAQSPGLCAR
ncbi:hypothetical protein PR048_000417 [Dryococelus australis]|uniref:Uncharacterized protein n=1 Tax=Dryococelus australis TaxID=614101 RepID=A0ABQ9IEJ5_9NEOP|nr:hypothetical protein PR048_000417 [Dryococelus australis]